ncbi:UDP-glucose 4-epimerase GalE [Magnetospirillum sp. SS-4]|uniref:UDP-glucose 4-epimerase GalE n=1 Tax=Magnetospirillum sp. SS-4 TaxID=2681465 RepID=UPI001383E68D|nr:UDP-glucose 4-epimerase GalE [Magnetospirillum sp. SS-4]CAA7612998.1 UDP-glucose 4-epimerase [Magnetospirillum sp. SS-4]
MRPSVLVTGGAGYIGSHTCKALSEAGWSPVAYDNLSGGHDWAVRWGPLEQGDVRDRQRLIEVMRLHHPVGVIHLAGLVDCRLDANTPLDFFDVNVGGTIALLQAMAAAGIPHLVYSSSAAVYGLGEFSPADEAHPVAPLNPFGRSKWVAEQIIADVGRDTGLSWTCLRYFNVAGADPAGEIGEAHHPETHLIPVAIEVAMQRRAAFLLFGRDHDTPDGTCMRDYVHVGDVAAANILALRRMMDGGWPLTLNVGTGEGWSVRQVLQQVERVSGQIVPVLVRDRRSGDPASLVGECSRARSLLDWKPVRSALPMMVEDAWRWHTQPQRLT